jgi:type II secretory pathway pseudopilin PulG
MNTPHAHRPSPRRHRRATARRGLGLVEMLISLSITSALLVAVAMATAASAKVVTENDAFLRARQNARVTLNLMLSDCRRGQPDPSSITATELRVLTAENVDRSYRYDAANQRILLINNDVPGDPGHAVARDVTSATFTAISSGTPAATSRVTVNLTITVGNNEVHLTGSAAPRQNAQY